MRKLPKDVPQIHNIKLVNRPRIFIGSSTEGKEVAKAIQRNLNDFAEVTVWHQGVFKLAVTIITNLINSLSNFDFAIFVFSPDDLTHFRGKKLLSVRDNVIFEMGLYAGKLGFEKVFFIKPKNQPNFHLPSDLLGVVAGEYDSARNDNNLDAATAPFCDMVEKSIKDVRGKEKAPKKNILLGDYDSIMESIPDTLHHLEQVIVEESKLSKQISIKNFGLDLENVMPWLRNNLFLKDILDDCHISYKGLIVDIEDIYIKKFIDGNSNIKSTFVKATLDSADLIKNIKLKDLKVEIRAYHILPTFHGFLLNNNHLFLSFTEIQDSKIFGGNYPYLYIRHDKTAKLNNHFINMFTSWFEYVWNDSKKIFKIPNK